jgi:hypothetical protein
MHFADDRKYPLQERSRSSEEQGKQFPSTRIWRDVARQLRQAVALRRSTMKWRADFEFRQRSSSISHDESDIGSIVFFGKDLNTHLHALQGL